MIGLTTSYERPPDLAALTRHYRAVQAPLARELPGLQAPVTHSEPAGERMTRLGARRPPSKGC